MAPLPLTPAHPTDNMQPKQQGAAPAAPTALDAAGKDANSPGVSEDTSGGKGNVQKEGDYQGGWLKLLSGGHQKAGNGDVGGAKPNTGDPDGGKGEGKGEEDGKGEYTDGWLNFLCNGSTGP
ncbi:hypothetical protein LTR08_000205 [Meristemomyces frigidus]|nr:hypothetical protein LTR08_000205 [Meristemomyces frigidus]